MLMMKPTVILKKRNLHESEDYQFLRNEGVKYVEQLASAVWTDYNLHDPGITILEALCYAITDLGYRTKFPIKDILAKEGDDFTKSIPPIFTAREILTCNPWTETDFRKMLVDVEGIHNAWLAICDEQEMDFFAECKKSRLSYYGKTHKLDIKKILPESNKYFYRKNEELIPIKTLDRKLRRKGLKFRKRTKSINKGESVLKKWIDGGGNHEAKEIKMEWLLEFPDPTQGDVLRRQKVYLTLPGWTEIDQRLHEFLPFLNHDVWVGVSFSNARFSTKSELWQGDVTVKFQLEKTGDHDITFKDVTIENVNETVVKNALEQALTDSNEQNVFYQYHQKLLQTLARLTEHNIRLRGLYDVLLEYDVDDRFGDLNSPLVHYRLYLPVPLLPNAGANKLEEVRLDILFPNWQTVYENLEAWYLFLQSPTIENVSFENDFGLIEETWRTDILIKYSGQDDLPDICLKEVVFTGIKNEEQLQEVKNNIDLKTEGSILGFLHGKWKKTLDITEVVESRLHEHRNLCEDFNHISNVGVNEVALCADIEVQADADLEKVLAQAFFEIENYLTPPVRFYTLQQMVGNGVPSEEIFEGPKLKHGFIVSEEIEKTSLNNNRVIYASDIVNIIMNVPGVLAVKDLLLTKYDQRGNPVLPSERWCLHIDPRHKAQLNRRKSKILFFKDQLPYIIRGDRYEKMEKELAKLFALADRSKLSQVDDDFPLPKGQVTDLNSYYPLRELLPKTYGVGDGDLPNGVPDARKGKAKQLQAYLAFFDQLLANYFSQLHHVRDLFSCDEPTLANLKRTYYTQFLSTKKIGADLWTNATALEDSGGIAGESSLQRLTESEETYLDRRNRFLDHLLARFAEQFTDYALLMETAAGLQDPAALIQDKVTFLKNYPSVSSQRGKGFNYKDAQRLWDTDNVPGLQKRVASLLGIENPDRRFLHCQSLRDAFVIEKMDGQDELLDDDVLAEAEGVFSFHLADREITLLTSSEVYNSEEEAYNAKEDLIEKMSVAENYLVVEEGARFIFKIGQVVEQFDEDAGIFQKTMPAPLAECTTSFGSAELATQAAGLLQQKINDDVLCVELYGGFQLNEMPLGFYSIKYSEDGTDVILGEKTFTSEAEAYYGIESLFRKMSRLNKYLIVEDGNQFFIEIGVVEDEEMIDLEGRSPVGYIDRAAAQTVANDLLEKWTMTCYCETEGFHLIEHILLRPKHEHQDEFMEVCLDENCRLCGEEDPYSFRATVVLPFWMERFLDEKMKIREYVERLLLSEAPAHVHLKICWADNRQMRRFEHRYKRWLEENAKRFPDPNILSQRLNDLLAVMGQLRNVYFQGFLHDCDDSEQERTIILNNSHLGTFDPGQGDDE